MGAMGLAGDLSSQSRFVRAVFHNANARGVDNAASFFHLLASVEMPDGSVKLAPVIPDVIISTDVDSGIMQIRPLKGLFDDED